jgi:phage repressor protein C with HTH and peptisase S24 domain
LDREIFLPDDIPMSEVTKSAATRLRQLREQAGLSQGALAEQLGWAQSAISKLENGERKLTLDKMVAIARALGVDVNLLTSGGTQAVEEMENNKSSFRKTTPMFKIMSSQKGVIPTARTLPVRGIAQGGEGRVYMLPESTPPVDWTYRPPILDGVDDAYALFVFDDSMRPMYRHGQTLWVHPHLPVISGEGVVIVKTDGAVIVKEMVRITDSIVTVREYRPVERDFDIPAEEIATKHRVVGVYQAR